MNRITPSVGRPTLPAMQPTDEQRERFLEHVREGCNRQQAAEKVADEYERPDLTATKWRQLTHREPDFNRLYQDALVEGRGSLVDRLERCAVELALGGNWPALRFLLTTYGEQFAWSRTSKVELGGQVEITAVAATLSKYLPSEMYDQLIATVEARMIEEQGLPAIVDAA
jgi:hypothetical protein